MNNLEQPISMQNQDHLSDQHTKMNSALLRIPANSPFQEQGSSGWGTSAVGTEINGNVMERGIILASQTSSVGVSRNAGVEPAIIEEEDRDHVKNSQENNSF